MGEFDDKFALLILLTGLESPLVFPPQRRFAAFAENVGDRVKPCQQQTLLRGAASNVHYGIEEVGAALASLSPRGGKELREYGVRKTRQRDISGKAAQMRSRITNT